MRRARARAALGAVLYCTLSPAVYAASTPIGDPYYVYYLYEHKQVGFGSFDLQLADSGVQSGGLLLKRHELGSSFLGFPADDMVSAYNDGKTFWSQTVAPKQGGAARDIVGGMSEVFIAQSYRKDSADASLAFSFTGGRLQLTDYGTGRGDGYALDAGSRFSIKVYNHATSELTFTESQFVRLYEHFGTEPGALDNTWQFTVTQDAGPLSRGLPPWSWKCDECGEGAYGFATANLLAPYSGPIALDFIPVGGEFTVTFYLMTYALDERQGETAALAYAKDPVTDGPGIGFVLSGLTPTDSPIVTAIPEPRAWLLMALGLGVLWVRWRARRASEPSARLAWSPECASAAG